jgi:hypothetical protein
MAAAVVVGGRLAAVMLPVDGDSLVAAAADERPIGRVGVGQGHEALGSRHGPGRRGGVAAVGNVHRRNAAARGAALGRALRGVPSRRLDGRGRF